MKTQTTTDTPNHHNAPTISHYYVLTFCVVLGHIGLVWAFFLSATQTPPKQKTTPIQIELQHITQTAPQKTDTPWNNPPKPQAIKPKDSQPTAKTHPNKTAKTTAPPKQSPQKPPKSLPPKKHPINQAAPNTPTPSEVHLPMPNTPTQDSPNHHTNHAKNLDTKTASPTANTPISTAQPSAQPDQPSAPTQDTAANQTQQPPTTQATTPKATPPSMPSQADPAIVKDWQAKVRLAIEQNLHYPPQALANQWQGKCLLQITVDDLGQVLNVSLKKSSGKTLLDNEAIATAKRASPLPKPPSELIQNNRFSFVIPINFNHKKYP